MGAARQITLSDLPTLGRAPVTTPSSVAAGPQSVPTLADVERELILKALAVHKDDKGSPPLGRLASRAGRSIDA